MNTIIKKIFSFFKAPDESELLRIKDEVKALKGKIDTIEKSNKFYEISLNNLHIAITSLNQKLELSIKEAEDLSKAVEVILYHFEEMYGGNSYSMNDKNDDFLN